MIETSLHNSTPGRSFQEIYDSNDNNNVFFISGLWKEIHDNNNNDNIVFFIDDDILCNRLGEGADAVLVGPHETGTLLVGHSPLECVWVFGLDSNTSWNCGLYEHKSCNLSNGLMELCPQKNNLWFLVS